MSFLLSIFYIALSLTTTIGFYIVSIDISICVSLSLSIKHSMPAPTPKMAVLVIGVTRIRRIWLSLFRERQIKLDKYVLYKFDTIANFTIASTSAMIPVSSHKSHCSFNDGSIYWTTLYDNLNIMFEDKQNTYSE